MPITLSLLALIVASGHLLWTLRPIPPAPSTVQSTPAISDELAARLSALENRLSQLENKPEPVAPPPVAVDLAPLEKRLSALESKPAMLDPATLDRVSQQIRQNLQSSQQESESRRLRVVAALQLITAWQAGQAFDAAWQAANASASEGDAFSQMLEDAAPTLLLWRNQGIPALATLTSTFPDMARAVVAASVAPGTSWWQQSVTRLRSLIVIRRQGQAVSANETAPDALLARAEVRLKAGDLAGAVSEVEKLEDSVSAPATDWLSAARARLQADALSTRLTQMVAAGMPSSLDDPAKPAEAPAP